MERINQNAIVEQRGSAIICGRFSLLKKLTTCETIQSSMLSLNSNSILASQVANCNIKHGMCPKEEVLIFYPDIC